jgi:hypothetical protein
MTALTVSKREPKRSRVFLSALVDSGTGPVDARIRDISTSGALLESETLPESGKPVDIYCGDTAVHGRVAWADRGWFGVEFDSPLTVEHLIDPFGAKLAVSAPRTYRSSDPLE